MTLLEMSLTGAVLVTVVTVVRALILHRLPKGTLLALWGLALARFLLPFSLPFPVSAYTLGRLGAAAVVSQTAAGTVSALPSPSSPALSPTPAAVAGNPVPLAEPFPLLPLVWEAGSIGVALFFAAVSFRCRGEFQFSLPAQAQAVRDWQAAHPLRRPVSVRISDRVSAPLTYGLLRPVILLPEGFDCSDARQLDHVLTHEWVHIRRFDGLWKLLTAAAVCLHWWNPLAWVLYVLFSRDLELACDEAVVRRCGGRADYARSLIWLEEQKSGLAPFCSNFNHNAMEERIFAIMKMKKMTRRTAAASAATVFAVGALFATSAAVGTEDTQYALPDDWNGGGAPAYWYPVAQVDWAGERELLESFEAHGISYDSEGHMYFEGERVRWFWDGYEIWEDGTLLGWSMRYEYLDKEGTVDVRTLHGVIDNGDGSLDYYGPLVDIVAYSQQEFDSRTYESIRRNSVGAVTDADAILTEDEAQSGGRVATVEDDAVLTEAEAHPGGQTAAVEDDTHLYSGSASGGVTSEVTENVALTEDVSVMQVQEGPVEVYRGGVPDSGSVSETEYLVQGGKASAVMEQAAVSAEATGTTSRGEAAKGRTFEEIFAQYRSYGITYREKDGIRELFYNGEPVAHFADIQPDGSAFTFESNGGTLGILRVQTVYDKAGKLAGVQPVGQSATYAPYTRFGLSDDGNGALTYQGQTVRCLDDSVPQKNGSTKAVGYCNAAGTVDVRAVRDAGGQLTGLEAASDEEFRSRKLRNLNR